MAPSLRADYRGMILMLTALNEDQDQIEGLLSGADDYVVKPSDSPLGGTRFTILLPVLKKAAPKQNP